MSPGSVAHYVRLTERKHMWRRNLISRNLRQSIVCHLVTAVQSHTRSTAASKCIHFPCHDLVWLRISYMACCAMRLHLLFNACLLPNGPKDKSLNIVLFAKPGSANNLQTYKRTRTATHQPAATQLAACLRSSTRQKHATPVEQILYAIWAIA